MNIGLFDGNDTIMTVYFMGMGRYLYKRYFLLE